MPRSRSYNHGYRFAFASGRVFCCLVLFSFLLLVKQAGARDLPKNFIYLDDIDSTIVQDIRYYGRYNFLGRRVKGYDARACILTRETAIALHNVQDWLLQRKLSLVVYDCYRPMRAIEDIIGWLHEPGESKTKSEFYSSFEKSELFNTQLLARYSAHARGSSVDVAIVPLPILPIRPFKTADENKECFGAYGQRRRDNALDFGSSFDCFHERSWTNNRGISDAAKSNRRLLVDAMAQEGFVNNKRAWWHFRLKKEPYAKTTFDFPISTKGTLDKQGLLRAMRPVFGPVKVKPSRLIPSGSMPPKPRSSPRSLIGPVR